MKTTTANAAQAFLDALRETANPFPLDTVWGQLATIRQNIIGAREKTGLTIIVDEVNEQGGIHVGCETAFIDEANKRWRRIQISADTDIPALVEWLGRERIEPVTGAVATGWEPSENLSGGAKDDTLLEDELVWWFRYENWAESHPPGVHSVKQMARERPSLWAAYWN